MKTLGEVIVKRMNKFLGERNITQYELAENSGVPYSTIKSIMQKKTNNIGLKTIIKLAKGFNISPSEFINDADFMSDELDIE